MTIYLWTLFLYFLCVQARFEFFFVFVCHFSGKFFLWFFDCHENQVPCCTLYSTLQFLFLLNCGMSKWWPLSGSGICDNCYLLDNCHVRINGIWVNCHIGTNGIDTSVLLGQMELSQLSYWDKWNWVNCRIDTTVLLGQMELSQQSLSQLSLSQLSFGQMSGHPFFAYKVAISWN